MYQQAPPDLEQRLSKLQAQLDRLSLALQQWQQAQEHLQPMEWRLSQLMQQSGEILDRLSATDQRHAHAVGEMETRLNELSSIEAPVKQLREHAANLDQITSAASSSVNEFARTESRFVALEEDLRGRLTQLSLDLQNAVTELRRVNDRRQALPGGPQAWPLEGVLRLHDELRQGAESPPLGRPEDGSAPKAAAQLPEATAALAERVASLERAVTGRNEELKEELKHELIDARNNTDQQRQRWRIAAAALAITVVAAAAVALGLQRRVDARLNDAAARVTAAERQAAAATELANRRVASTEDGAGRQIAEARAAARRAQTVTDVLAAPDLVRFNLTAGAAAPRAQLLWSRSHGLVFSASRLPAVPPGGTYQLWLLTMGDPVSGGMFVPDAAGLVTLVTDDPPRVPRPVVGVSVTQEPAGGRPSPTGPIMLQRVPTPGT